MKSNLQSHILTLIFLYCFLFNSNILAQDAYKIDWNKEWKYVLTGVGLNAIGYGIYATSPETGYDEWSKISYKDLPAIDQSAVFRNSSKADRVSDIFANGSFLLPSVVYLSKIRDKDWRKSSVMFLDLLLLNAAITNITKHSIRRYRPYVYRLNLQEGDKLGRSDRASFLSGHTMLASTNAFFAAAIFQKAYPDSPLVPFVYTSAAVYPAIVGIKRVQAGVHFPTDIIASYFVGMATAMVVIQIHKRDDISLNTSGNGIGLVYTF